MLRFSLSVCRYWYRSVYRCRGCILFCENGPFSDKIRELICLYIIAISIPIHSFHILFENYRHIKIIVQYPRCYPVFRKIIRIQAVYNFLHFFFIGKGGFYRIIHIVTRQILFRFVFVFIFFIFSVCYKPIFSVSVNCLGTGTATPPVLKNSGS